ncbi:MAG: 3'-5' exonuclease [Thermodesulfobacteriota bacterium]|nr:3'-5' exonuclease [Thermodesulfobacteriota bacterium]
MLGIFKKRDLRKRYELQTGRDELPDAVRKQLEVRDAYEGDTVISEASFVVFDTETTGLNLKKGDRLLSLGAVKMTGVQIHLGEAFYELIDPQRPIPSSSIFIHGITPGMAKARPHISEVLSSFLTYVGSHVLMAHHASFDMQFLNHAMEGCFGFPVQNIVIDTASVAGWIRRMEEVEVMDRESSADTRFDVVAAHFGITAQDRHSAFGDALSTALLFQRFINILSANGVKTLKELVRIGGLA